MMTLLIDVMRSSVQEYADFGPDPYGGGRDEAMEARTDHRNADKWTGSAVESTGGAVIKTERTVESKTYTPLEKPAFGATGRRPLMMYKMAHFVGNNPQFWRRQLFGDLAHGVKILDCTCNNPSPAYQL
jgi:hypothetical protein